jgi:two-component system chemotaxis response regulator CheB
MPEHFTLAFANRVNQLCNIYVKEAANGDIVDPGKALIAPGNYHMVLRNAGGRLSVDIKDGPKVHHQRPAVDVLFQSVAKANLKHVTAAILTGMGKDGAIGMKKLRDQGAHTIAQNEQTCVVYGMPKEAVALGAAEKILPIEQITAQLLNFAKS